MLGRWIVSFRDRMLYLMTKASAMVGGSPFCSQILSSWLTSHMHSFASELASPTVSYFSFSSPTRPPSLLLPCHYLGLTRHGPRAVWGQAALLTTLSLFVSHIIHPPPVSSGSHDLLRPPATAQFIRALNPRPGGVWLYRDLVVLGGVGWGAIFSPLLVSPELLSKFTKFKRHSIAVENLSRENNFIELGVTDDVTGQVKEKMFHRSRMFYGTRYNIEYIVSNKLYRKQSIERQLPSTHVASRGHWYQVRSQKTGHQRSTHETNLNRAVWCMVYGQFFSSNSMELVRRPSETVYVTFWWKSGQD